MTIKPKEKPKKNFYLTAPSLRSQVLLFFLFILIIPSAIIINAVVSQSQKVLIATVQQKLEALNKNARTEVDLWLTKNIKNSYSRLDGRDVEEIENILAQNIGFDSSIEAYLVNEDNIIVASTKEKDRKSRTNNAEFLISDKNQAEFQKNSSIYTNYKGKRVVGYYAELMELPLLLVTEQETNKITKEITSMKDNLPFIVILVLLLIILVNYYAQSTFVAPIKSLKNAIDSASRGDFDAPLRPSNVKELCATIKAFRGTQTKLNLMRKHLCGETEEKNKDLIIEKAKTDLMLKSIKKEQIKGDVLLASIDEGIIATNQKGKITFINRTAQTLLNLNPEEAIGKLIFKAIPLESEDGRRIAKNDRPAYMTLSLGKKTSENSYYYVRKNKTRFPSAIVASPIAVNEKRIGSIIVFRDITKEKEVDRAKSEFVSLASHQLRTPLTSIKWQTELILKEKIGALSIGQKNYVQSIYNLIKRMIALVNALLNVSRIDLGTFAVEPEPTDIREITKNTVRELANEALIKKITISKSYPRKKFLINIDPKLISIVLENLLSNAIKYSPENAKITISITNSKNEVLISVSDTGYGIPKAQHSKVFTKLFRADNIKEKVIEGTGLGLYIVKSIIERSDGKIWFVSNENEGTTFYISLPAKQKQKDRLEQ